LRRAGRRTARHTRRSTRSRPRSARSTAGKRTTATGRQRQGRQMNQVSADAPVNPARRQLFRRVATAGDPSAPHRAAWKQVIGINADDGLVLWSGWAQGSDVVIVGDEGTILHFNADTPTGGTWQQM